MRHALAHTAALLRKTSPGSYSDANLYHLTLAFLGEYPHAGMDQLVSALQAAVKNTSPFQLTLGDIGTFGPVLWRGVQAQPALDALAHGVRHSLDSAGIYYDPKPFRPHITLARDVQLSPDAHSIKLPGSSCTVRSVILYESTRASGHLAYVPRAEIQI